MLESISLSFGLIVLVLSPFVAHLVGWMTARDLRVPWGNIRDWMPSIPNNSVLDADASKRWEKRTRALEARLLRVLTKNPRDVTAARLASEIGEDVTIVAASLEKIREEIPCRLRVTRGGTLIHDFAPEDIARLRRRQAARGPRRLMLFVLAAFANIGATWPMILSVVVAVGSLLGMAATAAPVAVGGAGLAIIFGLMASNALFGWFFHLILTPWGGPRLGPTRSSEDRNGLVEETQPVRDYLATGGDAALDGGMALDAASNGCAVADLGDLGDADEGCAVIIIAALLIAVVVAFTAFIGIWLRGIWRAVKKLGVPDRILSPAAWIRGSTPVDWVERFVPTNDLVLRISRMMKRIMRGTHPEDGGMVRRVMARATERRGRISALEIMLEEGVDLDEAMTIGAQLTGYLSGEIYVGDEGEIEFVFPENALGLRAERPRDLHAEYIDFEDSGRPRRRHAQEDGKLPVNIPGLSHGHLVATDRLVAGTMLMQFCAMTLVHLYPETAPSLMVAVDVIFPLMTLGAFALSGAARYAASTMAQHGVKRDVRRAGFAAVNRALAVGEETVNFTRLAGDLERVFKPAWRKATAGRIRRELTGVAVDLDLEPTADGGFSVATLRRRLDVLAAERQEPVILGLEPEDADEVIFDTQVEHARDYAL